MSVSVDECERERSSSVMMTQQDRAARGEFSLVFMAPEKAVLSSMLFQRLRDKGKLGLVAVDEAATAARCLLPLHRNGPNGVIRIVLAIVTSSLPAVPLRLRVGSRFQT